MSELLELALYGALVGRQQLLHFDLIAAANRGLLREAPLLKPQLGRRCKGRGRKQENSSSSTSIWASGLFTHHLEIFATLPLEKEATSGGMRLGGLGERGQRIKGRRYRVQQVGKREVIGGGVVS